MSEQIGTATWMGEAGEYHLQGRVFMKDVPEQVAGKTLKACQKIGGFLVRVEAPKAVPAAVPAAEAPKAAAAAPKPAAPTKA